MPHMKVARTDDKITTAVELKSAAPCALVVCLFGAAVGTNAAAIGSGFKGFDTGRKLLGEALGSADGRSDGIVEGPTVGVDGSKEGAAVGA